MYKSAAHPSAFHFVSLTHKPPSSAVCTFGKVLTHSSNLMRRVTSRASSAGDGVFSRCIVDRGLFAVGDPGIFGLQCLRKLSGLVWGVGRQYNPRAKYRLKMHSRYPP